MRSEAPVTKLVLIAATCLMACGPRALSDQDGGAGDGGPTGPHTLSSISVTPTNPIVELDLNTPGSQAFEVHAIYADGADENVTASATLEVVNPAVGALNGATLEIPAFAAVAVETSRIHATYDSLEGDAQITVVAYRKTGATTDFFFVLPYVDPAGQVTKPLDFGTAVPALDVMFDMDTTGSMGGEIETLQSSLTGTVIPGIRDQVTNSQFGAASVRDFPVGSYGGSGDQPFQLLQAITSNASAVQSAVNGMSAGGGGDTPEGQMEALYQTATGAGLTTPSPTNIPAHTGGIGGVSFRAGAMPVIVSITDALFHGTGEARSCGSESSAYTGAVGAAAHTRAQTKTALKNICARSVGIATSAVNNDACSGRIDLEDFATATGARVPPSAWDITLPRPNGCSATQCCTGINGAGRAADDDGLCPLVFFADGTGAGVDDSIVTGIRMLARFAAFDVTSDRAGVTTSVDGVALPAPHTTADFIKQVTPTGFMLPPAPPVVPNPTFDATTFHGVTPGTRVQFDVRAFNDFVPQTDEAQIFRATLRVLAGGCTDLDQREVLILVPPTPIILL
jgi:hypothetical protein